MAIGKRLTDPVKVISVTCDTAIDRERTPIYDYQTDRDPKRVVALPGQALTWFTLRPLPGERAMHCRSYASPIAERVAFALSCAACSDASVFGPEAWEGEGTTRRLREDALDTLPDQLVMELGRVALELGGLTRGERPRFVPPAGLRVIRTHAIGTTAPSVESSTPESPGS